MRIYRQASSGVLMTDIGSPQAGIRCVRESLILPGNRNWRWTVNPRRAGRYIMLRFASTHLRARVSSDALVNCECSREQRSVRLQTVDGRARKRGGNV